MSVSLYVNPSAVPGEIYAMWETLAETYPLSNSPEAGALEVEFVPAPRQGDSIVKVSGGKARIACGGVSAAARGIGSLLAGLTETADHTEFKTLGIMLDCSRNAVMKVSYLKKWLRELALLGYGRVMLYTEDTYELPGEPFFGYMRGAYTREELKELNAYAARLGIEMVGCIQTLGHLEQMLRWPQYVKVRDTPSVMMVDEEATYELIEKMIANCAECFTSRTLHIGMDETHDLGRGRFLDHNGYERGFDLFNRHLARVVGICEKYGLKPMIWSDMYFRMGNPDGDYYSKATVIPADVKAKISGNVDLVYWDYYHVDEAFYTEWIQRHRDLGKEPLFGSGVWTWALFWYNHTITTRSVIPGLAAARKAKLEHVFFTMWGDDSAYCEYDSAMAGLAFAADLSWGCDAGGAGTAARTGAIANLDYELAVAFSDLEYPAGCDENAWPRVAGHTFLFDDPLLGLHTVDADIHVPGWYEQALALYDRLAATPIDHPESPLGHVRLIVEALAAKLRFRRRLETAYAKRDLVALDELAGIEVPKMVRYYKDLGVSFRRQWMRRNKPFGSEVMTTRLAGVSARFEEVAQRVRELLAGSIDSIAELDEAKKMHAGLERSGTYVARGVVSASVSS